MFTVENGQIIQKNGDALSINMYLAQKSVQDGKVRRLIEGTAFGEKAECAVKDGRLLISGSENGCLEVLLSLCKMLGLPINKCENCGKYFAPASRADEKYCDYAQNGSSCKKIGAGLQFRKNNAQDAGYALFTKHTKHLRYLKNKGDISANEFTTQYGQAKQYLADYRSQGLSLSDFEKALAGNPTVAAPKQNIASYLL